MTFARASCVPPADFAQGTSPQDRPTRSRETRLSKARRAPMPGNVVLNLALQNKYTWNKFTGPSHRRQPGCKNPCLLDIHRGDIGDRAGVAGQKPAVGSGLPRTGSRSLAGEHTLQ